MSYCAVQELGVATAAGRGTRILRRILGAFGEVRSGLGPRPASAPLTGSFLVFSSELPSFFSPGKKRFD